jgi:hypothetical protein
MKSNKKNSSLWKHLMVSLTIGILSLFLFPVGAYASTGLLRKGDQGQGVKDLQVALSERGYYHYRPDGVFGKYTHRGVVDFQDDMGLEPDGVVGPKTRAALGGTTTAQPSIAWSVVNPLFPVGSLAVITDIATGMKFVIRRLGGRYHADSEPKTTEDTRIFKKIAGNRWTWNRRAVTVDINGAVYPASINCMPHSVQNIYGNEFNGHFCVHFLGSRIHHSGRVDASHQRCVAQSEEYISEHSVEKTRYDDFVLLASRGYIDRSKIPSPPATPQVPTLTTL